MRSGEGETIIRRSWYRRPGMLRYTRVLYRGKAVVPGGEMEHEAQEAGSIGVQGAFASNSMHYTSPYTHQRHRLTTLFSLSLFLSQTHVQTHTLTHTISLVNVSSSFRYVRDQIFSDSTRAGFPSDSDGHCHGLPVASTRPNSTRSWLVHVWMT